MADTENQGIKTKKKFNAHSIWPNFKAWLYKNRYYLLAFFIPVAIVYIAYAMFDIYPFGDNSVLVLDLNGQYISYFEAIRDAVWGDGSIFYNWSRNLSGNYMGVIGYYLASPFTIIVILLPHRMILGSILIMQLCKIGASAVTFSLYLQKNKDVKPIHSVIFATMYATMAYMIVQLMDPMWLDGLVFLPLIIMGIERLVDGKKFIGYIIPLGIMFIANFYIGYMVGIFSCIYFLYYVIFGSDKLKRSAYNIFNAIIRFAVSSVIAIMCAAIMLLPVYYVLKLGKFDFSNPDFSFRLQFTAIDIIPKLFPLTYDTVRNEGLASLYCGVLSVLMLPLFFINKNISGRLKAGNALLLMIMFFSMYIKPVDMAWHGFQSPNWLPYRYSFMISFIILTMAVTAFKNLDGISSKTIWGCFAAFIIYLLYADKANYENVSTIGTVWFSIACLLAYSIITISIKDNKENRVLPVMLLVIISAELVTNTYYTFKDIDDDVTYSKHSSYYPQINLGRQITDELEESDPTLYRSEKTFYRTSNDNASYGLKGITHSSSVMNTKLMNFIGTLGYDQTSYYTRYNGATPISDSLLGIKYVMDKEDKTSRLYQAYAQTNDITIYQNPDALSVGGYMVDSDVINTEKFTKENPFENLNKILSTSVGKSKTTSEGTSYEKYFKPVTMTAGPIFDSNIITQSSYGDQMKFEKTAETGDATIEYQFKAATDDTIYAFFYTTVQRKVNLWVSTTKDESTGMFKTGSFKSLGQYFEARTYSIIKIGNFEPGQEFAVRMTIPNDSDYKYTIFKSVEMYQLDEDLYKEDIGTLTQQQMNITDWSGRKIEGTITADDNQIMMTSIPYEPGWTVKVDGKKVNHVAVYDALIGVPLSPGEHKITMSYIPQGLIPGTLITILGIGCIVFIYLQQKKKQSSKK